MARDCGMARDWNRCTPAQTAHRVMMPTVIAVTSKRVFDDRCVEDAPTNGSFAAIGVADSGVAGVASVAGLNSAASSAHVGRCAGSRLKHRRSSLAYSGGRSAGRATASERSRDQAGGVWLRASTRVMPSPQISPAVPILPCLDSGGSYGDGLAMLAADSPAGRIVSLASFS